MKKPARGGLVVISEGQEWALTMNTIVFVIGLLILPVATSVKSSEGGPTLICIPEAAAVVREANGSFTAGRLDTQTKFIQAFENRRRVVRMHPHDLVLFDHCGSEHVCESSGGFAGVFATHRDELGRLQFTALWFIGNDDARSANVAKGYCTSV